MVNTLGGLKEQVILWLNGENCQPELITEAINDALESLWMSLMLAALNVFMGGPLNVTFNAGDQRVTLVSIADPLIAPTVTDVASDDAARASVAYYISYTYVTESGSETLASPQTQHTTATGKLCSTAAPAFVPGAIGWNLYSAPYPNAGSVLPVLQNDAPLSFSVASVEPETGYTMDPNGPVTPTENTTGDNIAYIRHLEYNNYCLLQCTEY